LGYGYDFVFKYGINAFILAYWRAIKYNSEVFKVKKKHIDTFI